MIRSASDQRAPDAEPERFGSLLRRFRMDAGLSQERLAELARISTEAVSALERGTRRAPQRQTLSLLIEALALDPIKHEALTLAAVRPAQPRVRAPRVAQPSISFLQYVPAALTPFVGREPDVAAVLALCHSARLVSIVGPGGVGKSRLALESARVAAAEFPDAIYVVPLGQLLPHAPVFPAIAAALGIRDEGAVPLEERIHAAVGSRAVLIVIDNCEHVLNEIAPAVQFLLDNCPGVRILATSRERLRIAGERIHRLRPLSIGHAVDIFIDRAMAGGFDPSKNEDDLSIAAEICDRLDCVPLAIELAASCSDVWDFEAILTRLRERATLPAKPDRAALPQHRSMQAAVEWSYDRLEKDDALVLRHLAPMLGGCRLDDAQDIIASDGLSKDDVLYALFRLHEQSLIDADRAAVPRFQMLQTIRDFATLQLPEEERSLVNRRFARHYLSLVAGADADLRSVRQDAAIARIAAESTNVRAAIANLGSDPDVSATGLAALGALSHYALRTGTLTEAAEIYAAVDFAQFAPSIGLAAALAGAAFVELNRRFFSKAQIYAKRAREVAHAIADPWFEVYAAIAEHSVMARSGTVLPVESFEPYYARAVQLGDPWLLGTAAFRMAELVEPIDNAAANGHLEYALTCATSSGDPFAIQSIQLALAHSIGASDPRRAAEFVAAVWTKFASTLYVRKMSCVGALANIAVAMDRIDDAAFIAGVGLGILREIGAPDAARARLEVLAQQFGPASAGALAAGEQATEDDAGERIASFLHVACGR